jgi:hypothetical protein
MPALMIDRQTERDLPAQIPSHRFHRLLVRQAGAVLQQHHLGQLRRRDRRAPHPPRVALSEILVAHDPIAVLSQQREKRALRQRPNKLGRIEHPHLIRPRREHAPKGHKPAGQHATFSGAF